MSTSTILYFKLNFKCLSLENEWLELRARFGKIIRVRKSKRATLKVYRQDEIK